MSQRPFKRLAVIGAGNMGSGIAQKMATEGFEVTLVDVGDDQVARGLGIIRKTVEEGVERRIFKPDQARALLERVHATADWDALADADLVVEAVFEDAAVKREVFSKLDRVCRPDAVLGTNTSSLSVTELAAGTRHPERVLGLHYFYHPAKNRLVEVVPGRATSPEVVARAWTLQEQLGKTPIASADAYGFIVNRYFVPWLNEAVRLLEQGVADIPTIEAACKKAFGVGMGPFELMNVTGVPIALHAATTLGDKFGPLYAPADRLRQQVDSGDPWPLDGEVDASKRDAVSERMLGAVFYVAAALVDEKVGTIEDTDIGARVGLRWPCGPFELMNRHGVDRALSLVQKVAGRWALAVPSTLSGQASRAEPFRFRWIKSEVRDSIAWLTVNRPDAMNALNEAVVAQLHQAVRAAADDDRVRGIVIGGAGKAFIAGADIRFFVRNIDKGDLDRIVSFTRDGHALLEDIDDCPKPVVARVHGLALGGGLELALACDHLIASEKATLAFPETGIGIYPGLGGTQRTPRRIGAGLAKWMIFTGHMLSADEAAEIGLVDRVVPHSELDDACRLAVEGGRRASRPARDLSPEMAALAELFATADVESLREGRVETGGDPTLAKAVKRVGSKAPIALRLAGSLVDRAEREPLEQGLRAELEHLNEIFRSEDAYAGLSTLGRGKPQFKGR